MEKINDSDNPYNVEETLRKSVQRFQDESDFRKECYFQLSVSEPQKIINGLDNIAYWLDMPLTERLEEESR